MHLQVIHLIPCHVFCHIFQHIHRNCLTRHIKYKAPHRIFGIIPYLPPGHRSLLPAQLYHLENCSCRPVYPLRVSSLCDCRTVNLHSVAFLTKHRIPTAKSKEEIPFLHQVLCSLNHGKLFPGNILQILPKLLSYIAQFFRAKHNFRRFIHPKFPVTVTVPLCNLRDNLRLFISSSCFMQPRNRQCFLHRIPVRIFECQLHFLRCQGLMH